MTQKGIRHVNRTTIVRRAGMNRQLFNIISDVDNALTLAIQYIDRFIVALDKWAPNTHDVANLREDALLDRQSAVKLLTRHGVEYGLVPLVMKGEDDYANIEDRKENARGYPKRGAKLCIHRVTEAIAGQRKDMAWEDLLGQAVRVA